MTADRRDDTPSGTPDSTEPTDPESVDPEQGTAPDGTPVENPGG